MGASVSIPHLSDSEEIDIAEMIAAGYSIVSNKPNVDEDELIFPTGIFRDRDAFTKLMPNSIRALVFASEDLAKALKDLEQERERIQTKRKNVLRTYIPKPRKI